MVFVLNARLVLTQKLKQPNAQIVLMALPLPMVQLLLPHVKLVLEAVNVLNVLELLKEVALHAVQVMH